MRVSFIGRSDIDRELISQIPAHPMMPDQPQGSCMAFEDAGALGLIFHKNFDNEYSVEEGLRLYEQIRKPRLQEASVHARENLNERIGWSTSVDGPNKLTIEEVCGYDMRQHLQDILKESRSRSE
jgi:salicylate hydroxylase